ncbi:hypothetical protein P692DRAFT_20754285 [Suillus brevipes Sb2]|nr:hypothetical protein P692DRAFT_20754285 [Suillus brevipes Sb2]
METKKQKGLSLRPYICRSLNRGSSPSSKVVQSLRQHLSFLVPRHTHGPPVVEVAPGHKFTRLAAATLPEYKKVNDTRHPSSQQGSVPQENDTADIDSLPDVHWCKAFLCFYSCWSHGRLRMPQQIATLVVPTAAVNFVYIHPTLLYPPN